MDYLISSAPCKDVNNNTPGKNKSISRSIESANIETECQSELRNLMSCLNLDVICEYNTSLIPPNNSKY